MIKTRVQKLDIPPSGVLSVKLIPMGIRSLLSYVVVYPLERVLLSMFSRLRAKESFLQSTTRLDLYAIPTILPLYYTVCTVIAGH